MLRTIAIVSALLASATVAQAGAFEQASAAASFVTTKCDNLVLKPGVQNYVLSQVTDFANMTEWLYAYNELEFKTSAANVCKVIAAELPVLVLGN